MPENKNEGLPRFLLRALVTTAAVVLVMYLAKIWFVDAPRGRPAGKETAAVRREGNVPVISEEEADRHYGEFVCVEGKIVVSHNSGRACFLNFSRDFRQHFTVVIFARSFTSFPARPEEYYLGKKIRVTGYVKEYQGKPEIIVSDQEQIKILE